MSRTRRFYYWLHRQWNAWRGSRACPVCGRAYTDKTEGFVVYRDRRMEEVCQPERGLQAQAKARRHRPAFYP